MGMAGASTPPIYPTYLSGKITFSENSGCFTNILKRFPKIAKINLFQDSLKKPSKTVFFTITRLFQRVKSNFLTEEWTFQKN